MSEHRWAGRAAGLGWALAALLLALFGALPLLSSHLAPDEYVWLWNAAFLTPDAFPYGGLGVADVDRDGAPLAGLALHWLVRAIPPGDASVLGLPPAVWYRSLSLGLLCVAALATGRFARRALLPWIGAEAAAAAATASSVLLLVHPVSLRSVATLTCLGSLLSVAFAAGAAAVFLAGRQDRRPALLVPALALAAAAGLAGRDAWPLAPILAAAEFFSGRRYRPLLERLRTAGSTLAGFLLCAALRPLLTGSSSSLAPGWPLEHLYDPLSVGTLARLAESIGVLALPAKAGEPLDVFISGALLLVALQPGIQAARAAPRLWARLALAWLGALLGAAVLGRELWSEPPFFRLGVISATAAAVCVGLAVSASALSGWPRTAAVGLLAVGLSALSFRSSLAWRDSEARYSALSEDLAAAASLHGWDVRFLVLDPPQPAPGTPWASPRAILQLAAPAGAPDSDPEWPRVETLTTPAFLALARSGELDAWRAEGCVVLVPEGVLSPAGTGRTALRLPEPEPTSGAPSWRGESRSPDLDVEALGPEVLLIEASIRERPAELPPLRWRPTEVSAAGQELGGAWSSPEPGSEALYELSESLAWRLSGRVRRVWFEGSLARLERAEFVDRLPDPWQDAAAVAATAATVAPTHDGGDLLFPAPRDPTLAGTWSCALLDLDSLELETLPARAEEDGRIRVPRGTIPAGGPCYWELVCSRDGRALARGRGLIE